MKKGSLFIISAPSGAGKTSLIQEILKKRENLDFSISYTTRPPRKNEVHGKDYFFIDYNKFQFMINNNEFLEYANVHNYFYGTGKMHVFKKIEKGNDVILDIDYKGANIVKNNLKNSNINIISIFIVPPSFKVLKDRLISRGTDSEEIINIRLKNALEEIKHCSSYDYIIINDNFSEAVKNLEAIFISNSLKTNLLQDKVKKIIQSYTEIY